MAKLCVLVAMAALGHAQGQHLRASIFSRTSSSSFSSSSSWFPGPDGQMHKEVHTVESRTYRDEDGDVMKKTRTETNCADGHCQKSFTVAQPGGGFMMSNVMNARFEHMKVRFGEMKQRFGGRPAMPFTLRHIFNGFGQPMPQPPSPPGPQPVRIVAIMAPAHEAANVEAPTPSLLEGGLLENSMVALTFAVCTNIAAMSVVIAILKWRQRSARELSGLSEPLDPEAGLASAVLPSATAAAVPAKEAPAAGPAGEAMYLLNVYSRAFASIEKKATTAYLSRLYQKVIA